MSNFKNLRSVLTKGFFSCHYCHVLTRKCSLLHYPSTEGNISHVIVDVTVDFAFHPKELDFSHVTFNLIKEQPPVFRAAKRVFCR